MGTGQELQHRCLGALAVRAGLMAAAERHDLSEIETRAFVAALAAYEQARPRSRESADAMRYDLILLARLVAKAVLGRSISKYDALVAAIDAYEQSRARCR